MLAADIKAKLETCGLPLAYRMFPEGAAPSVPYAVWYIDEESNFPADNENYHNIKRLTIELYTKYKDQTSESAVEQSIADLGIWDKTEAYIDKEKCYQIVYNLEV